jgi:hypothetical protein
LAAVEPKMARGVSVNHSRADPKTAFQLLEHDAPVATTNNGAFVETYASAECSPSQSLRSCTSRPANRPVTRATKLAVALMRADISWTEASSPKVHRYNPLRWRSRRRCDCCRCERGPPAAENEWRFVPAVRVRLPALRRSTAAPHPARAGQPTSGPQLVNQLVQQANSSAGTIVVADRPDGAHNPEFPTTKSWPRTTVTACRPYRTHSGRGMSRLGARIRSSGPKLRSFIRLFRRNGSRLMGDCPRARCGGGGTCSGTASPAVPAGAGAMWCRSRHEPTRADGSG